MDIKKLREVHICYGEAEAIALYWQEKADLLATDDDNVRKKKELLKIELIGIPAIIFQLYQRKNISEEKCKSSIKKLRAVGWFSNAILDKVLLEVEQHAKGNRSTVK